MLETTGKMIHRLCGRESGTGFLGQNDQEHTTAQILRRWR